MKLLWDKMMWFRRWMLALHPGGAKAAKWELTTPVAFAAGMLGMLGSPAWDIMDSDEPRPHLCRTIGQSLRRAVPSWWRA
jgi:hypothetical protein